MQQPSFEEKLKTLIESRMSTISTLEEVYLNAEERQNELFKIIFQECYHYAIFNYISSITVENLQQKILQLRDIGVIKEGTNIEHFPSIILDQSISLDERVKKLIERKYIISYEDFKSRKSAEDFLIKNYELFGIKILDGNVKNENRAREKAQDRYGGDFRQVNDINRLTIVADSSDIIDSIMIKLKDKFTEDFLCREKWEMKPFGMITRGSYLFIDNFPCEIHFNEPLQMKTSKDITHRIYELYRVNIETDEQKSKFKQAFKQFILDSVNTDKYKKYNSDIKDVFQSYFHNPDSIERISDQQMIDIKNNLLILHINIHQKAICMAEKDWQATYLAALYQYNQKNPNRPMIPISTFSEEIKIKASLGVQQLSQDR